MNIDCTGLQNTSHRLFWSGMPGDLLEQNPELPLPSWLPEQRVKDRLRLHDALHVRFQQEQRNVQYP